jgi:alpha/beta superfamily hydrolase
VYVNFARDLANRGYTVLRFDYMGNGDSDGNFEDSSIETNLSDIRCALQVLREKVGFSCWFGVIGLRFGATLAALVAEPEADISRLVLWEPVVNGAQYMQELFAYQLDKSDGDIQGDPAKSRGARACHDGGPNR